MTDDRLRCVRVIPCLPLIGQIVVSHPLIGWCLMTPGQYHTRQTIACYACNAINIERSYTLMNIDVSITLWVVLLIRDIINVLRVYLKGRIPCQNTCHVSLMTESLLRDSKFKVKFPLHENSFLEEQRHFLDH